MNRVFCSVWNHTLGVMVAASELARRCCGRGVSGTGGTVVPSFFTVAQLGSLSLCVAVAWGAWVPAGLANPAGAKAIVGTASLATQGNQLTVTTQNGAGLSHSAINWQSFSVPAGSTTYFRQPSAGSMVINRVVTNTPSQLFGTLSSNGSLVLVNQAGIAVGAGAVVDTAGFTASSLAMSEADALTGRLRFGNATVSTAGLAVQGRILARSGDVVLLSPNIEVGRDALIQAPNGSAILAAGQQIEITGRGMEGIHLQVQAPSDKALNLGSLNGNAVAIFAGTLKHSGQIRADAVSVEGGRVVLKAGNQLTVDGQVTAQSLDHKGGSVHVTAPEVQIRSGAVLDASGAAGGGEVLIGGGYLGKDLRVTNAQFTSVDADTHLRADATLDGDGGRVIVWSDDTTRAFGRISARGGAQGGNGGLVETSGHRLLAVDGARVDTRADKGATGNWLLDPGDIIVTHSTTAVNGSLAVNGSVSVVSDFDINTALLTNNVALSTSSGSGGAGDITFNSSNSAIQITNSSNGPRTLTLSADRSIIFSGTNGTSFTSGTTSTAPLNMDLTAGTGAVQFSNVNVNTTGTLSVKAAGNVDIVGSNISSAGGFQLVQSRNAGVNLSASNIAPSLLAYAGSGTQSVEALAGGLNLSALDFIDGRKSAQIISAGQMSVQAGSLSLAAGLGLGAEAELKATGGALRIRTNGLTSTALSPFASIVSTTNDVELGPLGNSDMCIGGTSCTGFLLDPANLARVFPGTAAAGVLILGRAVVDTTYTGTLVVRGGATLSDSLVNGSRLALNGFNVVIDSGAKLGDGNSPLSKRLDILANQSITLNGALGAVSAPVGAVTATAGSSIDWNGTAVASRYDLNSVTAFRLGTNGSIRATDTGSSSIKLNAGAGTVSLRGAGALQTDATSRWLVYASNPANVTKNGLTSNFRHYSATKSTYANPTETGNGFIYASAPGDLSVNTLLASGAASSTYGNSPTAVWTYALTGFADKEDNAGNIGLTGSAIFNNLPTSNTAAGNLAVGYQGGLSSSLEYGFSAGSAATYEVTPRPLLIAADPKTKIFGQADPALTYSVGPTASGTGLVNGDALSGALTRFTGETVAGGPYAILQGTVSAGGNYAINYTGSALTITPAPLTPVLNSLVGSTSKVYDGNASAALSPSNFSLTGFVRNDGATVTKATGTFAGKDVGTGIAVTAALSPGDYSPVGSTDLGNYILPTTVSGNIGSITPRTVTLSAAKVYDGSTSLAGFVTVNTGINGESLGYSGARATSAHVSDNAVNFISAITLNDGAGGSASNYRVQLDRASAPVTLTARTLTPTLTNTGVTKVYDGSTSAPAGFTPSYNVAGLVPGDSATLSASAIAYDNAHVESASKLIVSGVSLGAVSGASGPQDGDYVLGAPGGSISVGAGITARTLTPTLTNTGITKVYDGSTSAPAGFAPSYSVAGLIGGDSDAVLTQGQVAYNSKDVANASTLVATGLSLARIVGSSSSLASDYILSTATTSSVPGSARITPRTLTATVSAPDKVYDGSTTATPTLSITQGLVGSESVTATGLASFNSKDVLSANRVTVTSTLLADGTGLASNYQLPVGQTSSAKITVRPAATWIATAGGLWSTAANWDALPDGANVLAVTIPAGVSVVYDASVSGDTQIQSLASAGALTLAGGSLSVSGSLSANQYTQTGGALSGAGSLTVGGGFNQSGGRIVLGGAVSLTQPSGDLNVGAMTAPSISLSASGGSIRQSAALVTPGLLSTQSFGGTLLGLSGNRVGQFRAVSSNSGNIELTNVGVLDVQGIMAQAGNITLANTGGIATSGPVTAGGGAVSMTSNSPLTVSEAGVMAAGNISLKATNLTSAGNMLLMGNVISSGGAIDLSAANNFEQNGRVVAALGVTLQAGGVTTFGPRATTLGNPTSYTVNGIVRPPPPASLESPASPVVVAFLSNFQKALGEQSSDWTVTEPGTAGEKKRANSAILVEGEMCVP